MHYMHEKVYILINKIISTNMSKVSKQDYTSLKQQYKSYPPSCRSKNIAKRMTCTVKKLAKILKNSILSALK